MAAPELQKSKDPPPEPRYQPLVVVLPAVAAGILWNRHCPLPLLAWLSIAALSLGCWAFCVFRIKICAAAILGHFFLMAAIIASAAAWHHCRWNLFGADDLGRYARCDAQPICLEAVAVDSPRNLPPTAPDPMSPWPATEGVRLHVDVVSLRNGSTWQPASGRATLVILGHPPVIEAGDRIRCFARFSSPRPPQNPGEMDRAAHLRADRVLSQIQAETPECISVIQTGSAWNLSRQLERVRSFCNRILQQSVARRQAELAAAVLLNFREELGNDRTEAFLTTGTVHVLVIAGLHIGLLAAMMLWLARRLPIPRGWSVAAIAAVMLFYALMVDFGPPVIRATILVLITCMALWLGRRPLGFNSLAAAALAVLAVNPCHLFHIGAQMSFLCVAALIWSSGNRRKLTSEEASLKRLIEENLSWPHRWTLGVSRWFLNLFTMSLVLWLASLPLVMARFHVFSPIGLIMGGLIWAPLAVCLASGLGVLTLGAIWTPLGKLCGLLCGASFGLLEKSIDVADALPCGHFWVPGPSDWWLIVFYSGLALAVAFPQFRPPRRWCVAIAAAWIVVGFTVSALRHDRHELDCTFLSVGHGTAVFVEFPSGQTLLYDAGHMGSPVAGAQTICDFLWDRGLCHVDAVVLSHADLDHYNALPRVLERFSVGTVFVSPVMFEKDNAAVLALHQAIKRHKVPVREIWAGNRLRVGDDCVAEALYPPRLAIFDPKNTNKNSLVLLLEYKGRRILLPGDLESPGMDDMLTEEPRRCDVLMAPHHGSRQSNSPGLAAWCKPRWVVFSGSVRWSSPEVDLTYQAVGACPLHTHLSGAIRTQLGKAGAKITPFLKHD
jgi:competence protein ComEC